MISDQHPILVVDDNITRRKPLGYGMTVTIMPRRNYPCSLGFGVNKICWRRKSLQRSVYDWKENQEEKYDTSVTYEFLKANWGCRSAWELALGILSASAAAK